MGKQWKLRKATAAAEELSRWRRTVRRSSGGSATATKGAASAFGAVSQRENPNQLKDQMRKLEADFTQALSTIEVLEAKSDATGKKNLEEAIMWYKRFLGSQVVGGEGVKFVFNKIDIQNPDNEYSFCIKLNKDRYNLLQCVPFLKDSEELVKDLNCSNDLFKFVRIMREKFQAAAINGLLPASSFRPETSSITDSSAPALSIDTGSDSTATTTNRSNTQSWAKNQENSTKRGSHPSNLLTSIVAPRVLWLQMQLIGLDTV